MDEFKDKKVVVIGLDPSGSAASRLLLERGAEVFALAPNGVKTSQIQTFRSEFPSVNLISENELPESIDFVVHTSQVSRSIPFLQRLISLAVPVLSDLELSHRFYSCLSVAITGTNGKTTTAEILSHMLGAAQRTTLRAGASGLPLCSVTAQSKELDFLTLDLNSFQLESVDLFRPAIAVVTNIRPDEMDKYGTIDNYARAIGNIFKNQQIFDWAIVQSEALAHFRSLNVPIPSKVITFSANNRRADIFLDRGLLISSLSNWSGPLFNMDQSNLRGPHHAENVMAALAAGRVLRLKLEEMIAAVKTYRTGPHRDQLVAESRGVKFINNSKAMNVHATQRSIEALDPAPGGEPNIWLIAGGVDKGLDYHDLGPLLARRVKGAFLLGEAREKLRSAWSLFTPCTLVNSLLEAVSRAAENAVAGDVVLLSPACSSLDMFQSYQQRGEAFREAVNHLLKNSPVSADLQYVKC
jgi:UDP-N-acetylmuramoylalanine--D-glutamate ligase